MERLSSKQTFLYKFVLPTVWIVAFGGATALMFVAPEWLDPEEDVSALRWIFLAALVAGTALFYWACMRAKVVSLDGADFVISNYRTTIRVPLRDVERVSASLLVNPELVWLHFRRPTELGSRIVFIPEPRVFGGFSRHPLARRLAELVAGPEAFH
ncbi:MAG: hypothetical protein KC560_21000 [Myxococcales bacterium]|nr:hypothetical protein [Myxococcales bacterium]